jgi:putative flippase GtrA
VSTTELELRPGAVDRRPPSVEIVVPVHDEAGELEEHVVRLRRYLDTSFPFEATVTIADNASTDGTWSIASALARRLSGVRAVHLEEPGRGRALRAAWLASQATVVAYMDVDLATGLDALLPLVAPLLSGHSDVAIGTRLARGARVVRGPKRELISRGYNLLVHAALHNEFSDAQCGFKALRADVARALVPMVEDDRWFFDTELLVLAERSGLRIHEVPVDWVDDPDSRVDIRRTAADDLRGIWRLMRRPATGCRADHRAALTAGRPPGSRLSRFAGVGLASTVAYVVLFLLLRRPIGVYGANALALFACTAGNTVAHRRLTFVEAGGPSGRDAFVGAAAVVVTGLALTSGALAAVEWWFPASALAEVAALVVASAAAGLLRFVVLQAWSFRSHRPTSPPPVPRSDIDVAASEVTAR